MNLQPIQLENYFGTIFRHFKGDLYLLLFLGKHTETEETLVAYKELYGECKIHFRPIEMFLSPVDKEKYPEATQLYRFEPFVIESVKM